jgi:hypothetical protein
MQLIEQRCGSVGRRQQKQQWRHGINIALCMLEGSSIPEQEEECFSAHCQRRQLTSYDVFQKMKYLSK